MAVKAAAGKKPAQRAGRGQRPASLQRAAVPVGLQQLVGNQALQGLVVQRKCGCGGPCCTDKDKLAVLQRSALGPATLPAVVQRSSGAPLPSATRGAMETSFGHDFSGVRVHTDGAAAAAAAGLNARAFTTGSDIYFGGGQYDPGSGGGRSLLAHELTHVVQQRSGRKPTAGIDTPGDAYEVEADRAAAAVARGERVRLAGAGAPPAVQRATATTAVPVPATTPLIVPGQKSSPAGDDIAKRYDNALKAKALVSTHAGRSKEVGGRTTDTLWNKWATTRPFKLIDDAGQELKPDAMIKDRKAAGCQVDHIIELQIGGADDPNNMRLLTAKRNTDAGSKMAGQLRSVANDLKTAANPKPFLVFNAVDVQPSIGNDTPCLDWELARLAGKAPAAAPTAGITIVNAVVGGNAVAIRVRADKSVDPVSQYAVPGFQLKDLVAPDTLTGVLSPRVRKIPVFKPRPLYQFKIGADKKLSLVQNDLPAEFKWLSEATLAMTLEPQFRAEGVLKPTHPLLKNVDVGLKLQQDLLEVSASPTPEKLKRALPVPGLEFTDVTLKIGFAAGQFTASGGFGLKYSTVADGRVEAKFGPQGFEATGTLNLHVPGLSEAKGQVYVRGGKLGGLITIGADKIKVPGVKSASLTVRIADGRLDGEGVVDLAVPGVKQGRLAFGVDEKGNYSISGTAVLSIPGTKEASLTLRYRDGDLEGAAHAGFAIPGLESATLDVLYKKGQLSGSAAIQYKKGKLSGTVTVNLSEKHKLSGGGELGYEIAPGLVAFAGMQIKEDGSMKISGGLRVPETIDLFKRKEVEKPIFKMPTIEIPILAIPLGTRSVGIVATIDAKLVARAGVGPGQLRKVKLLAELDPSKPDSSFAFHAAAELYVPADAELALQVAGGIGVSLAIVRAVGGIEAEGAAGLKAEFIAAADLKYENGQFAVSGKAELSAQPRLVFRLKAFVTVEADLFITTIEIYKKEWLLAQFEAGSALKVGVRLPFRYEFGKPFQLSLDQIEFIVPEIKPRELIKELLPK